MNMKYSLIIILLFIGCNGQKKQVLHEQAVGHYSYSMFLYSKSLDLMPDGTYKFFEHSCINRNYSEGTWRTYKNFVYLTSNNAGKLDSCFENYELYEKSTFKELANMISDFFDELKYKITPEFLLPEPYKLDTALWSDLATDSLIKNTGIWTKVNNCEKYFGIMNNYPFEFENDTLYEIYSDTTRTKTFLAIIKKR